MKLTFPPFRVSLKKAFGFLGERAFFVLLFLFLLAGLLTAAVWYFYVFPVRAPAGQDVPSEFSIQIFERILETRKARQEIFESVPAEPVRNIFQISLP